MISKERLEELIKQGATIWYYEYEPFISGYSSIIHIKSLKLDNEWVVRNCNGQPAKLYNGHYIENDKLRDKNMLFVSELKDIFETQKQAEWSLKYHATRTEELNLPMWEEIKDIKGVKEYTIANPIGICFFLNFHLVIPQIVLVAKEDLYNWNLTEENYIKACDLCLKLFKEN